MLLNSFVTGAASNYSKGPKEGSEGHEQNEFKEQQQLQRLGNSTRGNGAAASSGMSQISPRNRFFCLKFSLRCRI
jgi:hypothetical protein